MTDDEIKRRLCDLEEKMCELLELMQGDSENLGVIGKVHVLWKSWIWILCSASAALGSVLTAVLGIIVWLLTKGG